MDDVEFAQMVAAGGLNNDEDDLLEAVNEGAMRESSRHVIFWGGVGEEEEKDEEEDEEEEEEVDGAFDLLVRFRREMGHEDYRSGDSCNSESSSGATSSGATGSGSSPPPPPPQFPVPPPEEEEEDEEDEEEEEDVDRAGALLARFRRENGHDENVAEAAAMAIFIPDDALERSDYEIAEMYAAGLLNDPEDDMLEAINEGGLDLEGEEEGERERKKRKRRDDFCPGQ